MPTPEQIHPGFFIALYKRLLSHRMTRAQWESFLRDNEKELREHCGFYCGLKKTNLLEIQDGDSYALFSLQHFNDCLLVRFQQDYENRGEMTYEGIEITTNDYLDFWTKTLPFDHKPVKRFHPFYCEIVEVIESDGGEVEIVEEKWPCIMMGPLMFSRAGVVIRAPRKSGLIHGIADRSMLYNSTMRHYRPRSDPSDGWGHNSMWSTRFRVDLALKDRLIYNMNHGGSGYRDLNNGLDEPDEIHWEPIDGGVEGLRPCIELLRHRCQTNPEKCGEEPFWYTFIEYIPKKNEETLADVERAYIERANREAEDPDWFDHMRGLLSGRWSVSPIKRFGQLTKVEMRKLIEQEGIPAAYDYLNDNQKHPADANLRFLLAVLGGRWHQKLIPILANGVGGKDTLYGGGLKRDFMMMNNYLTAYRWANQGAVRQLHPEKLYNYFSEDADQRWAAVGLPRKYYDLRHFEEHPEDYTESEFKAVEQFKVKLADSGSALHKAFAQIQPLL